MLARLLALHCVISFQNAKDGTVRADKLKYWVSMNKALALSGGLLILASVNAKKTVIIKSVSLINTVSLLGRYFPSFASGHPK